MTITLHPSQLKKASNITISGSKSESNRLLLLKAIYPALSITNLSDSDDSEVMQKALKSKSDVIDIHHAGTAMRFLTAYFASQEGRAITLTGSDRMKERPIQILVDALRDLGAQIDYLENEGCPPLKITGSHLIKSKISLPAHVSSQYISALMLVAPSLDQGLEITLQGQITSIPYIKMTLQLLHQIGVKAHFENQTIKVYPKGQMTPKMITVESDWSSASYFYSFVALSDIGTQITLSSYKESSLQGDSILANIYKEFGVQTTFLEDSIVLEKVEINLDEKHFDLVTCPDIAQTIAVTCLGLGIKCDLVGLHTLKIKETDRLEALKTEIKKLGGIVSVTDKSLHLASSTSLNSNIEIETYHDHRMAMAFAPLALKTTLKIKDAMVVTKSYKAFWDDLEVIGVALSK